MKKKLILEDNPQRIAHFRREFPKSSIVETVQEAIDALQEWDWDYLSLDHDLGGEVFVDNARPDCGMEVVRWLVENKPPIRHVTIHTANRGASERMYAALVEAGYETTRAPFGGQYDPRG